MFVLDVSLGDWDIFAEGIAEVILANSKIFNDAETLVVDPVNIFSDGKVVIAKFIIIVDHADQLRVLDILEFRGVVKSLQLKHIKGSTN